jgi:hypothetical protein
MGLSLSFTLSQTLPLRVSCQSHSHEYSVVSVPLWLESQISLAPR